MVYRRLGMPGLLFLAEVLSTARQFDHVKEMPMWRFDRQAILQDRFTRSGAMISSNVSGTPMVVPSSTRAPWSDISRITQSSTDNPLLKISLPPLNVRRRIWDLRSFMRRLTFADSWNVHGHAPLG